MAHFVLHGVLSLPGHGGPRLRGSLGPLLPGGTVRHILDLCPPGRQAGQLWPAPRRRSSHPFGAVGRPVHPTGGQWLVCLAGCGGCAALRSTPGSAEHPVCVRVPQHCAAEALFVRVQPARGGLANHEQVLLRRAGLVPPVGHGDCEERVEEAVHLPGLLPGLEPPHAQAPSVGRPRARARAGRHPTGSRRPADLEGDVAGSCPGRRRHG
mmetsp:Transcript_32902/g.83963  ORF Transcript_32902/g.83963 Transcript_32902/m.83963 type:complete len:210 (-) Transcript_32902:609-1238(-)